MNGMNFKPFISNVLDSLSDAEIGEFARLIDSHSNKFSNRSLVKGNITTDDKGVGLFTIQLDNETIRTGYLVYTDDYCVLLSYVSNSERIVEYDIDLDKNTYVVVKEYITTDYLRHEIAIRATSAGTIDLSGYVQKTQTIAGIALSGNIIASALTDALVFANNDDIDALF